MLQKSTKQTTLYLILVISMILSSCGLFNNSISIRYPQSDQDFKEAIDWHTSILSDKRSPDKTRARAHLRLGLLYSHYRNPAQDFDKALEHIEASISLDKDSPPDDSLTNLMILLKSITGKDTGSIPALRRLKDANNALTTENNELKKTLKKLNELEVELERKRKLIR